MKKVLAVASWIFAVVIASVSLFLPPTGVIDSSVLILIAQLFILAATFLGVDSYVNIIKSKFNAGGK